MNFNKKILELQLECFNIEKSEWINFLSTTKNSKDEYIIACVNDRIEALEKLIEDCENILNNQNINIL